MFNPTAVVIDAFVEELKQAYTATYTTLEPDYPGIIAYVGHMALELIANSDAPYHDLSHTVCVTLVGQEVIRGKHLRQGGVSPRDWLHFIISLLCHDIGYVRGICGHDGGGRYAVNANGETIGLPTGATDASLAPHHVERGKLFVRERFSKNNGRRTSLGNWPTSTTFGRDRRSSWNSLRPAWTRSSATRPLPNCVPRIPRSFGRW